jgi:peptide/nickel transport system permease protein
MVGFMVRRLGWAVVLFLVVTLYTFILFFVVPYHDINLGARSGGLSDEASTVQDSLGIEGDNVVSAYTQFLSRVVHGDLGRSFYNRRPVSELVATAIPATASLVFGGMIVYLLVGFTVGILTALRPRSLLDRASMVFILVGISAHPLWIGYMLALVFGHRLGWFPPSGYCDVFYTTSACGGPVQWAYHLVLPWIAFAAAFAALYARMIRTSLQETLGEDYVRTARAKGHGTMGVVRSHALRPALLPVVTMLGMDLALAFGGALFVERAFALPGLGNLLYAALQRHDLPVILGVIIVVTTAILIFNLFVDLAYGFLDPRTRTTSAPRRVERGRMAAPATEPRPAPVPQSSA